MSLNQNDISLYFVVNKQETGDNKSTYVLQKYHSTTDLFQKFKWYVLRRFSYTKYYVSMHMSGSHHVTSWLETYVTNFNHFLHTCSLRFIAVTIIKRKCVLNVGKKLWRIKIVLFKKVNFYVKSVTTVCPFPYKKHTCVSTRILHSNSLKFGNLFHCGNIYTIDCRTSEAHKSPFRKLHTHLEHTILDLTSVPVP